MNVLHRWVAVGLIAAAAALPAHAGRPCETRPAQAADVVRGMTLAANTAQRLDTSGAQVVVLARAGQDLSRYGLAWSHLGFAYRDGSAWRVVHKLNLCGTASAALYRQGLGEFFLDQPHRYEAAFVELSPDAQARLKPLLADNTRIAGLHEPRYSMVAYAWGTRYQQSNQWALETLAGAMDSAASSRQRAQAWLQQQGYAPSTLRIDALTRLGGRLTRANIEFDDHPNAKRFADRIDTVTVDSVFAWLQRSGLGATPVVIR
ncbi:MAG TPA: DUF2145 domain-containing protein [Burkholderiaceae bacterium]|nr:DUF2145 domain-containing protein [Burkholderiaceae bacterium]